MPRPPAHRGPSPAGGATPDPDARLAELVAGLTGCTTAGALHAVREHAAGPTDALAIVARAMVTVDQPPPAGLRVPGAGIVAGTAPDGPALVHHGSLRRWERLRPGPTGPVAEGPATVTPTVVDLTGGDDPVVPAVDLTDGAGPVASTVDLSDAPG